jgi:hypothetical protein
MTTQLPSKQQQDFQDWRGCTSFFGTYNPGFSGQVLPAPPAGYCYVFTGANIRNPSGSATLTSATLFDGAVPIWQALAIGPAATTALGSPQLVTAGAVNMTVVGAAGSQAQLALSYAVVALSFVQPNNMALTTSFQVVPVTVPVGKVARIYGTLPYYPALHYFAFLALNTELASPSGIEMKVTRGVNVWFNFQSISANASGARNNMAVMYPPDLLPGDVFEVRCTAAPPNPGNVAVLIAHALLPAA